MTLFLIIGHEEAGISGVYYSKPQTPLPGNIVCKTTILHGYTSFTPGEVHAIINNLSLEFMGTSYNLLYKNCNHFTNALLLRLTDCPAPTWLNRATVVGSAFPCIVPQNYIKPPECEVPTRASSDSLIPSHAIGPSRDRAEKSYDEMSVSQPSTNFVSMPGWLKKQHTASLLLKSQRPIAVPPKSGSADVSQIRKDAEEEPFLISTRYTDEKSDMEVDSIEKECVSDSLITDEKVKKTKTRVRSGIVYEKTPRVAGYSSFSQTSPIASVGVVTSSEESRTHSCRSQQIDGTYYNNDDGSSVSRDSDIESASAFSRFLSDSISFLGWSYSSR